MSMTLNKAAKWIKDLRDRYSKQAEEYEAQGALIPMDVLYPYIQSLDLALAALRGPTREMVKRMFRGCADCQRKTCVSCRRFGRVPERCIDCNNQDKWSPWNFCPACGRPLTDMAVDMMLERWKEAFDNG